MSKSFNIKRIMPGGYDAALEAVPAALQSQGFGVLTEIDIQATLKKKLDVDFRRYRIFGACNPPLAHQALSADLAVGLMLPCNVVVYEGDDGEAVVMAIDPTATIAATGDPALTALAEQVKARLTAALDTLG